MKQGNTASYVHSTFWRNLKLSCKEAEGCSGDQEALICPGLVRARTSTSQLWNWCKKNSRKNNNNNNHHHRHTSSSTLGQRHPRGTAAHGGPVPGQGHPRGSAAHGGPMPEWVCCLWRASCSMDTHEGLQPADYHCGHTSPNLLLRQEAACCLTGGIVMDWM